MHPLKPSTKSPGMQRIIHIVMSATKLPEPRDLSLAYSHSNICTILDCRGNFSCLFQEFFIYLPHLGRITLRALMAALRHI